MSNNRIIFLSATLISASAFAQEPTQTGNQPAYGDNPNLIKVLSVKAQETVSNTANQVGAATERGVAKIKPSVDSAWQNTKELTTETAVQLRDGARQGIDTAVKKTQSLKQNLTGAGGVPIERGSLSHPKQNSQSITPVSAPLATTSREAIQVDTNTQRLESSPMPTTPINSVSHDSNNIIDSTEPAIQRQTIALPAQTGDTPTRNAQTGDNSAVTENAQLAPANEDSGVPR